MNAPAKKSKKNTALLIGGGGLLLFLLLRSRQTIAATQTTDAPPSGDKLGPGTVQMPQDFDFRDPYGFITGPSIPGAEAGYSTPIPDASNPIPVQPGLPPNYPAPEPYPTAPPPTPVVGPPTSATDPSQVMLTIPPPPKCGGKSVAVFTMHGGAKGLTKHAWVCYGGYGSSKGRAQWTAKFKKCAGSSGGCVYGPRGTNLRPYSAGLTY